MPDSTEAQLQSQFPPEPIPIFAQKLVQKCHVVLPDSPKPISAIYYEGLFYAFVRFYSAQDAAKRGAVRLTERGNKVLLTRVPKGLVLWVHEPDAKLARKPLVR